jgi:hypothetical protein
MTRTRWRNRTRSGYPLQGYVFEMAFCSGHARLIGADQQPSSRSLTICSQKREVHGRLSWRSRTGVGSERNPMPSDCRGCIMTMHLSSPFAFAEEPSA